MSSVPARIMAYLSRRVPPSLKDKLLSIHLIRKIRDRVYKGSKLRPFVIPGLPFEVYLYINLAHPGERLHITRNHEPHVVRWLLENVKPGWVALDIGSFIGYYAVILGKLCGPKGQVIAFEPIPQLKEQILLSALENGLSNVIVETMAAGASSGVVEMYIHHDEEGGFGTSSSVRRFKGSPRVSVKAISIDDYVAEHNLPRVDLIKIDVEGAELDVLEGARTTLQSFQPVVLIEFNNEHDYQRGLQFLDELGYKCQVLGRASYGVHVVAKRKERV